MTASSNTKPTRTTIGYYLFPLQVILTEAAIKVFTKLRTAFWDTAKREMKGRRKKKWKNTTDCS